MNESGIGRRWVGLAPYLLSMLRIIAAVMFILAGTMKLFAYPIGMPPKGTTASFPTQIWFAGVLEVFGGGFVLLGFCTRPIAFVLSGLMAVAYFQAHQPQAFWPTMNGGVAAVLYCFVFLYISASGPGPWSVDAMRRK